MFSQFLPSIDRLPGLLASPVFITSLCAGLVFFSVQFLMRRRFRRSSDRPSAAAIPVTDEDREESRVARALRRAPVPVLVTDAATEVPPLTGFVINRSTTGICLELAEEGEVAPGTEVNVRPSETGDSVPWVLVRVQKVRRSTGAWQLDCDYDRVPPYSIRMLFG